MRRCRPLSPRGAKFVQVVRLLEAEHIKRSAEKAEGGGHGQFVGRRDMATYIES